jgi:aspartate carbamoyltransferase regulatory subunit
MFIRMALLLRMTEKPRKTPPPPPKSADFICRNPKCVTQREPYLPHLVNAAGACGYCDKE